MSDLDLVNKIFEICAEFGKKDVHYEVEENGTRVWDDGLHTVIQGACNQILNAFENFEEK